MLIASKYEEIYAPIVSDFEYITDNAYDKKEILAQERTMLAELDFDIESTSSYRFLLRYTKVAKVDHFLQNLARYLIELSLVYYKMVKYPPSLIASASLYLAMKMTCHRNPWSHDLEQSSQYKESELRNCAKELFIILSETQTSTLQAVKKKFTLEKFSKVATLKIDSDKKNS